MSKEKVRFRLKGKIFDGETDIKTEILAEGPLIKLFEELPGLISLEHDLAMGTGIYPAAIMIPEKYRPEGVTTGTILGREIIWGDRFAMVYVPTRE